MFAGEEHLQGDKRRKLLEQLESSGGKWKLVEHWEDSDSYRNEYSSQKFYVKNGLDGFVPVHYEELG